MFKLIFLIHFSVLFVANFGNASFGFNVVEESFSEKPGTYIGIRSVNMPRTRTQDSANLCQSIVASYIIDHANCVAKKIDNCEIVPDSEKASVLDMARYLKNPIKGDDGSDPLSFPGLVLDGAPPAYAIINVAEKSRSFVNEACAPFDQFVSKIKDPAEARNIEAMMWKRLEDSFNAYKRAQKKCAQCGLETVTALEKNLEKDFQIKKNHTEVLKAFAEESFSKFADKILVPDRCFGDTGIIDLKGLWRGHIFPEKGAPRTNYDTAIGKIKENLSAGRPLAYLMCAEEPASSKSLRDCTRPRNSENEGGAHTVVIKGYRRVCNSKNECRDSLQVQNTWGQSWQDNNNDGWVDAKTLLDRSFYDPGMFTWLEAY